MSTETASNPFEKPTDELRQVRVLVCEPSGAASFYHYVVQRKWIVPRINTNAEVWRDLPIVDERDV